MSVFVKGMQMPDSCAVCRFAGRGGYFMERIVCMFTGKNEDAENVDRLSDCPLIALPDHHGRLMDADALCEDLLGRWSVAETRKEDLIKAVMADVVTPIIACQPIIVEAEGDE